MEERVPDIIEEALEWTILAKKAVGTVRGHEVELWFVPHRAGPGSTVRVVVDDFFTARRHFPDVERGEDYFDLLVRKHNLTVVYPG